MTTGYLAVVAAASRGNTGTPTQPGDAVGALGTAGLGFKGTIKAQTGNGAAIIIKSLAYPAVTLSLAAGESFELRDPIDLSQIQAKSANAGDVLKLFGVVNPGWA